MAAAKPKDYRSRHPLIDILRKERQKQGLAQVDIAVALNMTQRAFIYYELEQRKPNMLTFIDWADSLGFDVELKKKEAKC